MFLPVVLPGSFFHFFGPLFSYHLISAVAQAPKVHFIVITNLIQSRCDAFNCSWHHTKHCSEKMTAGGEEREGGREGGKGEERGETGSDLSAAFTLSLDGQPGLRRGLDLDWGPACARCCTRRGTELPPSGPSVSPSWAASPKAGYL